jgi:lipopolysaccharide transport protein LptA
MNRLFTMGILCGTVLMAASCTKREDPREEEEWAEIQALEDDAVKVPMPVSAKPEKIPAIGSTIQGLHPQSGQDVVDEFDEYILRLEQMKAAERKPGQTLLTGERLIFDNEEHFVRMDENVLVVDDRGEMEAQSVTGRFSVSNEVEYIEAHDHVLIRSEGRIGRADDALYDYKNGYVQLEGKASVEEGLNRLSGERIRFWVEGDRKMVCEPNAVLVIADTSGVEVGGVSGVGGGAEIRSDRLIYDQSKSLAEMDGNVRLRDPRMAMNCGEARIFFKDDNKIDWIEALFEVIIQSDDRKALAERATYHADEGKFTLEGKPKVMQGPSVMTGDRITFWYETRRMVCEPNARALLYLDEETKAKFRKDLND